MSITTDVRDVVTSHGTHTCHNSQTDDRSYLHSDQPPSLVRVVVRTHVPTEHTAQHFTSEEERAVGPLEDGFTPLKLLYTPVKSLEQLQTESELSALNIERLRSFTPSWHAVTALQRRDSAREYESRKKQELVSLKQRLMDSYSAIAGLEKQILDREMDMCHSSDKQRKLGVIEQLQRMLKGEQIHNAELQNQVDLLEEELSLRLTRGVDRGSPVSEELVTPFSLRDMSSFTIKNDISNAPAASLRNNTLHLLNVWENKALARNAELLSRFGPIRPKGVDSEISYEPVGARVLGWRAQKHAAQLKFMKLPSVITWFTKPKAVSEKWTSERTPDWKATSFSSLNESLQTTTSTILSRNSTPKVFSKSPFPRSPYSPFASVDLKEENAATPPPRSDLTAVSSDHQWSSKPSVVTWAERGCSSDGESHTAQQSGVQEPTLKTAAQPPESGDYPLAFLTLRPSPHATFDGDCSRIVLDVPFEGEEANDLNNVVRAMDWGGWPSSGGRLNPRRVVAERVLGGTLKVEVRIEECDDDGQLGAATVASAMEKRVAAAAVQAHQKALEEAAPPIDVKPQVAAEAPPPPVEKRALSSVGVQAAVPMEPIVLQPPTKVVKTMEVQTDPVWVPPPPRVVEDVQVQQRAVPMNNPAPPVPEEQAPGCSCVIS